MSQTGEATTFGFAARHWCPSGALHQRSGDIARHCWELSPPAAAMCVPLPSTWLEMSGWWSSSALPSMPRPAAYRRRGCLFDGSLLPPRAAAASSVLISARQFFKLLDECGQIFRDRLFGAGVLRPDSLPDRHQELPPLSRREV